jgi:hypothetical protein
MATTLIIIPKTQPIDITAYVKFLVAIKSIIKAKAIAINMPDLAELTNAFSLGINVQASPDVWKRDFSSAGALSLWKEVKSSHFKYSGILISDGLLFERFVSA